MRFLLRSPGQAPVDIKHHGDIMIDFFKSSSVVFNEHVLLGPKNKGCITTHFIFGVNELLDERGRVESELRLSDKLPSLRSNPKSIYGMLKARTQENSLSLCHPLTPLLCSLVRLYINSGEGCVTVFSADLKKGYVRKNVFLCEACSLNTAEQNTDFPVKKGSVLRSWLFQKKSY